MTVSSDPSEKEPGFLEEKFTDAVETLETKTRRLVREYPLTALGVAFAAGLVLSGRLFGRPVARAVSGGVTGLVGRGAWAVAKPAALYAAQQALVSKFLTPEPVAHRPPSPLDPI